MMTREEALARLGAGPTVNGRCIGHLEYDRKYGTVLVIDWHDPEGCEHVTTGPCKGCQ